MPRMCTTEQLRVRTVSMLECRMPVSSPVRKLHSLRRSFGAAAAAEKLKWMETITSAPRVAVRELEYHPACVEIDWDEVEDEARLTSTLEMLLTAIENEAMEDVQMWWAEWAQRVRPPGFRSDLEFVLSLFQRSRFSAREQANLYEALGLPIRVRLNEVGMGRCEVELATARVAYQKREIARERFDLSREIQRPLRKPRALADAEGREVVAIAIRALASRNLEIHPLLNANPRDVLLFDAGRGVRVALVGVVPEHRGTLAGLYFFLVAKNGVPVAYGPASPFLGSCEMGINLFPEFRGGEIRFVYAQVMRLLHAVLAVEHFFLTSYGMGVGNADAIRSGAFWFYRRLGFAASNPVGEKLAASEEARMRAEPGYRSSVRMLRRLSDTEASLDLSDGRCRRFPFGRLGLAVSGFIARRFHGDRTTATRQCTREAVRVLGTGVREWSPDERRALSEWAPLLSMIPELARWSAADRAALALRSRPVRNGARQFSGAPRPRNEKPTINAAARTCASSPRRCVRSGRSTRRWQRAAGPSSPCTVPALAASSPAARSDAP